jgi:hypothetical protein
MSKTARITTATLAIAGAIASLALLPGWLAWPPAWLCIIAAALTWQEE